MTLSKFIWKIPITSSPEDLADKFFKVFNTWIPTSNELLIDVADYKHTHDGPQTLLVGLHADYIFDTGDNETGLVYRLKRPLKKDFPENLKDSFEAINNAVERLTQDNTFENRLEFGNRFDFIVNDRLFNDDPKILAEEICATLTTLKLSDICLKPNERIKIAFENQQ